MFDRKQKSFDIENFDRISLDPVFEQGDNTSARARYRRFAAAAIRYLPPRQSEVISLYFLENLTMQETALRLEVSKSTVSRRLAAGKTTLRRLAQLCETAGLFPS